MPTATVSIHVPMFDTNAPDQNSANGLRRSGASDPESLTPAPSHTATAVPGCLAAAVPGEHRRRGAFGGRVRHNRGVSRPHRTPVPLGPVLLGLALVAAGLLASGCGDDPRERISGATNRARCMADGATAALGGEVVDAVRDAGGDVGALGELASAKGSELRNALDDCVDVQQTLTDALVDAGLGETKAACVADRALHDDKILGPLLVSMVFGDPGITTAVAIAVRAGGPCLTAEDVDRILPG
jgi:hypothetical protein